MSPQGYSNIHQGAIWGYHMLSSTTPLTEAQGYDTSTVKVIILMTDGENTVNGYDSSNMNKADGYMAYGYPGGAGHTLQRAHLFDRLPNACERFRCNGGDGRQGARDLHAGKGTGRHR